jgi:hypothetical protein
VTTPLVETAALYAAGIEATKPKTAAFIRDLSAEAERMREERSRAGAVIDALEVALDHYGPGFYERVGPSPMSRLLRALERYKEGS